MARLDLRDVISTADLVAWAERHSTDACVVELVEVARALVERPPAPKRTRDRGRWVLDKHFVSEWGRINSLRN